MFEDYYSGSFFLQPLAKLLNVQVDKVNFVSCQLFALLVSFFMRKFLHPDRINPVFRHAFSSFVGISLILFCFGNETCHLIALSTICYVIIRCCHPKVMHHLVFVVSMSYLAFIHARRMYFYFGSYNLDITGPLMVMMQRVSGLAFSLHDGMTQPPDVGDYRKEYQIEHLPGPLEYYGYLFQYQTILAGPNVFYKRYVEFIRGDNFRRHSLRNNLIRNNVETVEPSSVGIALNKLGWSIAYMAVHLLAYKFPVSYTKENVFYEWGVIRKLGYLVASTMLHRFMYYHAWTLADAICNASGLGFNGYAQDGSPKWDLTTNVYVWKFEMADNLRANINAWNLGTNIWLRLVVYERIRKYRTPITFVVSALWHGFYPGYYWTFLSGALFTEAARNVRRYVRRFFVGNSTLKMIYDAATTITTRVVLAYFIAPFILLDFWTPFKIYKSMYFFIHVLGILATVILPKITPKQTRD